MPLDKWKTKLVTAVKLCTKHIDCRNIFWKVVLPSTIICRKLTLSDKIRLDVTFSILYHESQTAGSKDVFFRHSHRVLRIRAFSFIVIIL